MYVDKMTEFSDAQAVTATAISTNVLDLFSTVTGGDTNITPNTRIDIGAGEDVYLVVSVPVAITDTSSDATLVVTLEAADDAGLTTNAQVLYSTGTLAFATYASAGTRICAVKIPSFAARRYLGVRYTVASGPFTAGAIDAFLTTNIDANRPYKSGFTVQ